MRYLFVLIFISTVLISHAQVMDGDKKVIQSINSISKLPRYISFANKQEISNEGGHLQGVQFYKFESDDYLFMSGSNSLYSYLATLDVADQSVLNIYPLFSKPLKHAGGFQICQNVLAIGIEDNDLRNYSELCFYDLSNPKAFKADPVYSIKRKGEFERATAGCVALTRLDNNWLVVVGDWNTRHLDFYVSHDLILEHGFDLIQQMTLQEQDKSEWIDTTWLPYQNINLWLSDTDLYLFGMTTFDGANILDTYRLNHYHLSDFHLTKIGSRELQGLGGNFIWGAGIHIEDTVIKSVIATPRNLQEVNHVYIYPVEK